MTRVGDHTITLGGWSNRPRTRILAYRWHVTNCRGQARVDDIAEILETAAQVAAVV
jgi:hypothetical protein